MRVNSYFKYLLKAAAKEFVYNVYFKGALLKASPMKFRIFEENNI